jgi:hypothetical protein
VQFVALPGAARSLSSLFSMTLMEQELQVITFRESNPQASGFAFQI